MHRHALLIVGSAIVIIVLSGLYWMMTTRTPANLNDASANTNRITIINDNPTPRIVNLPNEVKGQHSLEGKITADGVALTVSSFDQGTTWLGETAPKDSRFVVVYFDGVDSPDVLKVKNSLQKEAHLTSSIGPIALNGLKVANTMVRNDRGYLKFVVANRAQNLVLEVGTGPSAQRVSIPK